MQNLYASGEQKSFWLVAITQQTSTMQISVVKLDLSAQLNLTNTVFLPQWPQRKKTAIKKLDGKVLEKYDYFGRVWIEISVNDRENITEIMVSATSIIPYER